MQCSVSPAHTWGRPHNGVFAHAFHNTRRPHLVVRSAQASEPRLLPVPSLAEAQVAQAASAIEAAWRAGVKRQRIELLLPLIGATDLDDWPGGIRQQFKAAQPLLEKILLAVKQVDGLQGPLSAEIWDDGDAVACWKGTKLAAVIFPTAATVDRLRKLAEGPNAPDLLVIVNPQWRVGALQQAGNLVSDFGLFGREAKEKFVGTFTATYWFTQQRVYGDIVRTLYGYPNQWQVHVDIAGPAARPNRAPAAECIAALAVQPTYQKVEALLRARPESSINKSVAQRLQEEWEFNRKSLDGPK